MSLFGVFLFCIFPQSERIWRDTPYLSVFSPNAGRSRIEKLRIQTLVTQWKSVKCSISILPENIRKLIFFLTSLEGTEMEHYAKMGKRKKVMLMIALGEKCPYLEFFGSVFSRIRTDYSVYLHIQSECRKMRTKKFPNTDFFHAVLSWVVIDLQSNNHFHNILRLFYVLPNFPFTTSETMQDHYL